MQRSRAAAAGRVGGNPAPQRQQLRRTNGTTDKAAAVQAKLPYQLKATESLAVALAEVPETPGYNLSLVVPARPGAGPGWDAQSHDTIKHAVVHALHGLMPEAAVIKAADVYVDTSSRNEMVYYCMRVRCPTDLATQLTAAITGSGALRMDWGRGSRVPATVYQGAKPESTRYFVQMTVERQERWNAKSIHALLTGNGVHVLWVVEIGPNSGDFCGTEEMPEWEWLKPGINDKQGFLAHIAGGHAVVNHLSAEGGLVTVGAPTGVSYKVRGRRVIPQLPAAGPAAGAGTHRGAAAAGRPERSGTGMPASGLQPNSAATAVIAQVAARAARDAALAAGVGVIAATKASQDAFDAVWEAAGANVRRAQPAGASATPAGQPAATGPAPSGAVPVRPEAPPAMPPPCPAVAGMVQAVVRQACDTGNPVEAENPPDRDMQEAWEEPRHPGRQPSPTGEVEVVAGGRFELLTELTEPMEGVEIAEAPAAAADSPALAVGPASTVAAASAGARPAPAEMAPVDPGARPAHAELALVGLAAATTRRRRVASEAAGGTAHAADTSQRGALVPSHSAKRPRRSPDAADADDAMEGMEADGGAALHGGEAEEVEAAPGSRQYTGPPLLYPPRAPSSLDHLAAFGLSHTLPRTQAALAAMPRRTKSTNSVGNNSAWYAVAGGIDGPFIYRVWQEAELKSQGTQGGKVKSFNGKNAYAEACRHMALYGVLDAYVARLSAPAADELATGGHGADAERG